MLEVKELTFGYEEEPVLNKVSLSVNENEILLIEGSNGAGKTTLLKCIAGIINNGKNIFINDCEVFESRKLLKTISFVMSEDFLYDYLTVEENIMFFKELFEEKEDFLEKVKGYCHKLAMEEYMGMLVKNLSQGTRNKLYLAIMLSKKHRILILDEPFTALDADTQRVIMGIVENYKKIADKCVIMVTHIDEFKKIATRSFKINKYEI